MQTIIYRNKENRHFSLILNNWKQNYTIKHKGCSHKSWARLQIVYKCISHQRAASISKYVFPCVSLVNHPCFDIIQFHKDCYIFNFPTPPIFKCTYYHHQSLNVNDGTKIIDYPIGPYINFGCIVISNSSVCEYGW